MIVALHLPLRSYYSKLPCRRRGSKRERGCLNLASVIAFCPVRNTFFLCLSMGLHCDEETVRGIYLGCNVGFSEFAFKSFASSGCDIGCTEDKLNFKGKFSNHQFTSWQGQVCLFITCGPRFTLCRARTRSKMTRARMAIRSALQQFYTPKKCARSRPQISPSTFPTPPDNYDPKR